MINKKIIVFTFFLQLFCLAYAGNWTIFFYMAADNGLHPSALKDIVELQKGKFRSSQNVEIIVYIDHIPAYNNGDVEILRILPNESDMIVSQVLKRTLDEDSSNPETLSKFLDWAYSRYSSQRNALVIWSHSSGWIGKSNEFKWICSDNTANNAMSISNGEFRNAFKRHNKKYDIIVLDACNAGSLEIAYEIYNYADYIVSSPKEVPVSGFPWESILEEWDNSLTTEETAQRLVDEYLHAYLFGSVYNPFGTQNQQLTASVIDTAFFDDFITELNVFSNYFADENSYTEILKARQKSPVYNDLNADVDFSFFLNELNEIYSSNNFEPGFFDVVNRLYIINNKLHSHRASLNLPYDAGLSLFFPLSYNMFEVLFYNHWSKLEFAKTNWSRFMNYTFGDDVHPPRKIDELNIRINLSTLYLDWEIPVDPCPLSFKLVLCNDDNLMLETKISTENKADFAIDKSGFIKIYTVDEAGNESVPVMRSFSFDPPDENSFYITPNPVSMSDSVFLRFYLMRDSSLIDLEIYHLSGRKLYSKRINGLKKGEHRYCIKNSIESLSTGTYFAVIHIDGQRKVNKFAIIR